MIRSSFLAAGAAGLAALLLSTGCGYIAGTLAPLANVPATPQDLSAIQRGSNIIAHFTVPNLTTEQVPIKGDLELDLRAGPPPNPWNESEWSAHARQIAPTRLIPIPAGRKSEAGHIAEYQFPSTAWTGKEIVIAARVVGANHKASNWSKLLTMQVSAPLPAPSGLKAQAMANGIRLTWNGAAGSAAHYRVMRRIVSPEGADFAELAVTTAPEYLDATAEFGKTYAYIVLAYAEAAPHQEAQSDLSEAATLAYKNTFPPAAPTGLRAIASTATIELSWESNAETNIAGYRIYRSSNGGAFEKIAEVDAIPAYSDHAVEHGKTYRYAVAAIDKNGMESARSSEAEVAW